jgi:radical SAM superfamily enzyme YgiQ (UPF0313 family)
MPELIQVGGATPHPTRESVTRKRPIKVLFVFYDALRPGLASYEGTYYSGIASISAYLKRDGFETALLHLLQPIGREKFQDQIRQHDPDLVAFTSTTIVFPRVLELSRWCKQTLDVPTIIGGIHPTLVPEECIQHPSFDVVCVNEGERPMLELCTSLRDEGKIANDIPGLWVRDGEQIIRNPQRALQDLNELPFPDNSLFDYENLETGLRKMGVVMASKGCAFRCTYCCNRTLVEELGVTTKEYVRFKDVDYAIAELKHEVESYPWIERLRFDDDVLPMRKAWFARFAEAYKSEIGLPYECNIHPNLATPKIVSLMKYSGCDTVAIGLESGNHEIRNKVLGRAIPQSRLIQAFGLCKEAGIYTYSYNLVGVPHESKRAMLDTVKLNAEMQTDQSQCTFFYPFHKTPLRKMCEEEGLLTDREVHNAGADTALKYSRSDLYFIRFVRHYFRMLISVYGAFMHKMPKALGTGLMKLMDAILVNRVVAYVVLVPANLLIKIAYKSPFLFKIARRVKQALFERGWAKRTSTHV